MESMGIGVGDEQYEYNDDQEVYYENMQQEISYLHSEYAYELSRNSELQINKEKIGIAKRRRDKIVSYYDNYIYEDYNFDINDEETYENIIERFEENLNTSIDDDYQSILILIRDEEFKRLQKEEMKAPPMLYQQSAYDDYYDEYQEGNIKSLIPPPPPPPSNGIINTRNMRGRRKSIEHMNQSNLLYQVDPIDEQNEKEWMRNLKTRKFKIYMNKKKYQRLQIKRIEYESKIQEWNTQNDIKMKLKKLEELHRVVEKYTNYRIEYIKNVNTELNVLRDTIHKLMSKCVIDVAANKTVTNGGTNV